MKAGNVKGFPFQAFLAALVVAAVASAGGSTHELTAGHPWIGEEAPAFELQSTAGQTVALDDFRGERFVVIHFAASW